MGKNLKIETELTELEQSHLMDALITWENEVNKRLKEELAENKGNVPLFGEGFASNLVHDIKIKLNLNKGMEKNGIISLNN